MSKYELLEDSLGRHIIDTETNKTLTLEDIFSALNRLDDIIKNPECSLKTSKECRVYKICTRRGYGKDDNSIATCGTASGANAWLKAKVLSGRG